MVPVLYFRRSDRYRPTPSLIAAPRVVQADMPSPTLRESAGRTSALNAVVVSALFLSGALALVYEVCWIRKSSFIFGSTNLALSTMLAVFFAGLCIGSHVFGRQSRRTPCPLGTYGILEAGIGIWACLTPWGFSLCDSVFSAVWLSIHENAGLIAAVRVLLITFVVLPATILMGGTLPLVTHHYALQYRSITRPVGLLYGVNTVGAAAGCALCGLVLIPRVGINASVYSGGILNLLIGTGIWLMARRPQTDIVHNERVEDEFTPNRTHDDVAGNAGTRRRTIVLLFFVSGFVALGNEILWSRFLTLLVQNTVYTYTLTLTSVLIGIVCGSVVTALFITRTQRRALLFGVCQALTGLLVLAVMRAPVEWWGESPALSAILCCMIAPAMLSGMCFPLAVRMIAASATETGPVVGRMAAVNTAGGIAGSLVVGFFLLPAAGLQLSLTVLTGLSVLCGCGAVVLVERLSASARILSVVGLGGIWAVLLLAADSSLPAAFLARGRDLVDFREGAGSNVAVIRVGEELQLESDRLWQGSTTIHHQASAAHVPAILHSDPKRVLVVGLGPGQTASRFLMHDVEHLDCVEIEAALVDLVRRHFDSEWMNDPRVRILIDDGRTRLMHSPEQYDLISIEVGQLFRPGVASFYTREFYQRARERMNADGLICQFVPADFLGPDEFQTVIATFRDVFPECALWFNTSELLLLGTNGDGIRLQGNRLRKLSQDKRIRSDLSFSYWGGSPNYLRKKEVFLGGFIMGSTGIERLSGDVPLYREDRPFLEYLVDRDMARTSDIPDIGVIEQHLHEQQKIAGLLQKYLEPVSDILERPLDEEVSEAVSRIQRDNIRELEARVLASLGDRLQLDGRPEEAREKYRAAVQAMPGHVEANLRLGQMLQASGEVEAAIERFRAALSTNPEHASGHLQLGMALAQGDSFSSALQHVQRAVDLDADLTQARVMLGRLLCSDGQVEKALMVLDEALSATPDDTDLKMAVAWLLATNPDEGLRNASRAVDLARDAVARRRSALTLDTLAAAYAADGRFDHAARTAGMAFRVAEANGKQTLASEIGGRMRLFENSRVYSEARASPARQ